jgi:integrase
MRPGEVCILRGCDLDTTGAIWLYRPQYHKLTWRGKPRVIAIGPKGQEIIRRFFKLDLQAYLFSPAKSEERRRATMRQKRKSKVQPSQRKRTKSRPKKQPKDRYTTSSFEHAVRAGCDKAFPAPEPLCRREGESKKTWLQRLTPDQKTGLIEWQKSHRWHPNQLRHSHATEVRRQFGLEAAQSTLGHAHANVSEIYAERNTELACRVAAAIG